MTDQSLFEKYGGFGQVSRIVLAFYDRALDSDVIGDFFADIDMPRLVDHQTKFIASLLGGPASFTDERLAQSHARLNVSHVQFDEMARILAGTLADHGFAPDDVERVVGEIERRRRLIVSG